MAGFYEEDSFSCARIRDPILRHLLGPGMTVKANSEATRGKISNFTGFAP